MRIFVMLVITALLTGAAFAQENDLVHRDMDEIRVKINEIKEVVQRDYEALLATDPEASGTITVSFLITPVGTVADVSIDCPGELTVIREDIISVLEEIDFGPVPDQIEDIPVTVPFTLTPPE
ncbi:MAG: hypothetical protein KAH54_12045 [Candidatus Sabulitectum sp.]|nr:hypothetical protein [Candidatus Sabulitectum sp.]